MTDREKLIELLDVIGAICNVLCEVNEDGSGVYEIMGGDYIADMLIAHGVTVQEWRPGSEPPKEPGNYIVMIQGSTYPTELFWSAKRKKWVEISDDDFDVTYEVTHWMPLPEPPKGE